MCFRKSQKYLEAGADVLFVEAPENRDQMEKMNFQFSDRVPLLANMVEGGKTPISGADDLEELGYSIVIFREGTVRAVSLLCRNIWDN
ncbi:MAG: hypothetical protein CM15mP62_30900 [Rhodospirillaceae bacterium]|nr:MAG: hypothetical protein CM15mP62_30900 [Rhodospirillaceae bacterium]